jgi:hypothetical protein
MTLDRSIVSDKNTDIVVGDNLTSSSGRSLPWAKEISTAMRSPIRTGACRRSGLSGRERARAYVLLHIYTCITMPFPFLSCKNDCLLATYYLSLTVVEVDESMIGSCKRRLCCACRFSVGFPKKIGVAARQI